MSRFFSSLVFVQIVRATRRVNITPRRIADQGLFWAIHLGKRTGSFGLGKVEKPQYLKPLLQAPTVDLLQGLADD
jgi:hypothetical protein